MSTARDETKPLTAEQREAAEQLAEAAKRLVHLSPANELKTVPAFVAALNDGTARVRVEIDLPSGSIRVLADWPEMQKDALLCAELRTKRTGLN